MNCSGVRNDGLLIRGHAPLLVYQVSDRVEEIVDKSQLLCLFR